MGYFKEQHDDLDVRMIGDLDACKRHAKEATQYYRAMENVYKGTPVWASHKSSGPGDFPVQIHVQNIAGQKQVRIYADAGGEVGKEEKERPFEGYINAEYYMPYFVTYEIESAPYTDEIYTTPTGILLCNGTFDYPAQFIEKFEDPEDIAQRLRNSILTPAPVEGIGLVDLLSEGTNPSETVTESIEENHSGQDEDVTASGTVETELQSPEGTTIEGPETLNFSFTPAGWVTWCPSSTAGNHHFTTSGSYYLCGNGQSCFYDEEHYGILYTKINDNQSFTGHWGGNTHSRSRVMMRFRHMVDPTLEFRVDCCADTQICAYSCNRSFRPYCSNPEGSGGVDCSCWLPPFTMEVCWADGTDYLYYRVNNEAYIEHSGTGHLLGPYEERPMEVGDGYDTGTPWHYHVHIVAPWGMQNSGSVCVNVNGETYTLWEESMGYFGYVLDEEDQADLRDWFDSGRSNVRVPQNEVEMGPVTNYGDAWQTGEEELGRRPCSGSSPTTMSSAKYFYFGESRQIFIYSFISRSWPIELVKCYNEIHFPEFYQDDYSIWAYTEGWDKHDDCYGPCGYEDRYVDCRGLYEGIKACDVRFPQSGHAERLYNCRMRQTGAKFVYGIVYAGEGWPEALRGNHVTEVPFEVMPVPHSHCTVEGKTVSFEIGLAVQAVLVKDLEGTNYDVAY